MRIDAAGCTHRSARNVVPENRPTNPLHQPGRRITNDPISTTTNIATFEPVASLLQHATTDALVLFDIDYANEEVRWVHDSLLPLLETLRRRNIPTMGLTKLLTRPFGVIDDAVAWRSKNLARLGSHFMDGSPIQEAMVLDHFDVGYGFPRVKEGII